MDMVIKWYAAVAILLAILGDIPLDQPALMLVFAYLCLSNASVQFVLNGAPIYA